MAVRSGWTKKMVDIVSWVVSVPGQEETLPSCTPPCIDHGGPATASLVPSGTQWPVLTLHKYKEML
jgi:hypothetical protein